MKERNIEFENWLQKEQLKDNAWRLFFPQLAEQFPTQTLDELLKIGFNRDFSEGILIARKYNEIKAEKNR